MKKRPFKAGELFTWRSWGDGFVNVNESGHLEILTDSQTDARIDLHELLEQVHKQSVRPPVLVRFPQLIDQQMAKLNSGTVPAAEAGVSA